MSEPNRFRYECRDCDSAVELVGQQQPEELPERHTHLRLACGCTISPIKEKPSELPQNWIQNMDREKPTSTEN